MSVIYLLLGVSVTVAVLFFLVFWLAVRNGQFDDAYTPSVRMLFDDELVGPKDSSGKKKRSEADGHKLQHTNSLGTHGDSAV